MELYLGLGSNEGNRPEHLRAAINALRERGVRVRAVSPVVESPALLPPDAPAEWNRPFLNLVIWGIVISVAAYPAHIALTAKLGGRTRLSSVLLTFSTDSMGFFIFLGLASLFLI